MNGLDNEEVLQQLADLQKAAWEQVREQRETNRLLRAIATTYGAVQSRRGLSTEAAGLRKIAKTEAVGKAAAGGPGPKEEDGGG